MNLHEYYVPDFELLINDAALPKGLREAITSVSLTAGLEGADRVEVAIANLARIWVDHPALEVRKKDPQRLSLSLGYRPSPLIPMFFGELTGLTASFPSNGVMQLTVTAQDKRHRMKQSTRNTIHGQPSGQQGNKPIPDTQITTDLAKRYGLEITRDSVEGTIGPLVAKGAQLGLSGDPDSQQKGIRRQANESDYDLLRRIARESGWEMVIDHSATGKGQTLRFLHPPGNRNVAATLVYGLSLIDFSPKESLVGQVKSVSTHLKVPATGEKHGITLSVNDNLTELTLTTTPNPPTPKATNQPEDAVVLQEPLTPATAPRRLLSELMTRTNQRLTGSGSTIGDPRIRPGCVIELDGLGLRFGGLYRVTSVTHTIDSSGYKTKFEVRKELGLHGLDTQVQGAKPARKPSKASS